MLKKIFLSMLIFCELSFCYKILVVFPFPKRSHFILGEGFVRHLLEAGHEVTYISSGPIDPAPRLRFIDVSSIAELLSGDHEISVRNYESRKAPSRMSVILKRMNDLGNATALHPNVQELIMDPKERFDAVIIEHMFDTVLSGLASVFDCPLIWSISMDIHNLFLSLIDDPANPAYSATTWTDHDPPFTFWTRVSQLFRLVLHKYYRWLMFDKENEIFTKAFGEAVAMRGRLLPSYDSVRYNASLMLGNSVPSMTFGKCLPQSYKQIGGYYIKDQVEPLPEELEAIMNNARHGVIYFSLGSILRSEDMSDDMKMDILEVFSHLKQTVIWKLSDTFRNIPKNVHIVSWAPQQSILAHHNCVLFITHGGLLSLIEALHVGIPVIGIPVFADQFININRVVNKGYGINVDVGSSLAKNLKLAIEDMMNNPRYMEKAKEHSAIYHHRVVPPAVELVHSVEHVIKTHGATHLRSPGFHVPFYQKMYLDLAVLIFIVVWILVQTIKFIFVSIKQYKIKIKRH